ncbi:MAG TPA: hypothetical protein VMZ91_09650 [Candidatus Paceibacterota bacterium]|nr:hypothetical protein [Candidatus Paceibacterota bacterium]
MNLKTIIANTLNILGEAVARTSEVLTGTCRDSGRCINYNPGATVCTEKHHRDDYKESSEEHPRCYKPRNPAEQKTQES